MSFTCLVSPKHLGIQLGKGSEEGKDTHSSLESQTTNIWPWTFCIKSLASKCFKVVQDIPLSIQTVTPHESQQRQQKNTLPVQYTQTKHCTIEWSTKDLTKGREHWAFEINQISQHATSRSSHKKNQINIAQQTQFKSEKMQHTQMEINSRKHEKD